MSNRSDVAVYYCELCEKTHSLITKGATCPTCGRRYCLDSIRQSKLHGVKSCPYCQRTEFEDFIGLELKQEILFVPQIKEIPDELSQTTVISTKKNDYVEKTEILSEIEFPPQRGSEVNMAIEASKTFTPMTIPSYRRFEIMTENTIKSSGSTEVEYLQLQDQIPEGFEPPSKDRVEILKGDIQISEDDYTLEVTEGNLVITIERLEYSALGTLKQNEEILIKYPFFATARPDEEFNGSITVSGNVFPPVKPVTAEAEAGPIVVVHDRRKLKIGKMVRSSQALNEYEIVIRGVNESTTLIRNVEVRDFLPQGFELVSDTKEDPPVGFEEHSSLNNGKAMKWVYNEVLPGKKVEIRFKIRAPGDLDPKDVYRMLLG